MYAGFFGLEQSPFSIAPDPHYLYLSERHREALAHLLYGVRGGGGFVLLTGEIGAGKTTVCRAFLEQVPAHCRVAYIFNPKLTVGDLLKTICHEFRIDVRHDGPGPATIKDYLDPLNKYLLDSHAQGQQNLLIIDEAQSLAPDVLEQLRLLTNLETAERKLLQIMLIGQPELRQMLASPELEQVAQRVIARYHLDALDAAETRRYIQHRMAVGGLKGPLPFGDAALGRIHALTRGIPRRINLLCDRALLGAYASDRREVDLPIVERAAREVFDAPAPAPHAAQTGRRTAWTSLGLGALGGMAVVGLAAAALWQWPQWWGALAPAPALGTVVAPALPSAPASAPGPSAPEPQPAALPAATAASVNPDTAAKGAETDPTPPVATALTTQESPPGRALLLTTESSAWQALAGLWTLDLPAQDPCAAAQAQGLQCFRTARMTLHGLRQLDRPGVLILQTPEGSARALLTGIDGDLFTLRAGDQAWRMHEKDLSRHWRGDYATLWRTPPGTRIRIGNVQTGPAADWAGDRLVQLQAAGGLPSDASGFAARLAAFQRAQGIEGNGRVTPMTFMQLNRLTGVDEPRLTAP